jgi:hypothetical protein
MMGIGKTIQKMDKEDCSSKMVSSQDIGKMIKDKVKVDLE